MLDKIRVLHLFSQKKTFTIPEIVDIITSTGHGNRICSKVPNGTDKNVAFVIDTTKLKSPEDIQANDLGVWRNNVVRRCSIACGKYQLVRSYFYHKESKDYRRVIFQLYG